MNNIHRAIFYISVLFLVLDLYLMARLTSQEYSKLEDGFLIRSTLVWVGLFILLFYPYMVLRSLIDVFRRRRKPRFLWSSIVLLLPPIGPYIYFEKFIFPMRGVSHEVGIGPTIELSMKASSLRTAWRRGAAAVLDYGVYVGTMSAYIWILGTPAGDNTRVVHGFGFLVTMIGIWYVYFPLVEGWRGRTLGKALLSVTVVMYSGLKVTFVAALKRHLLDFVDMMYFGFVAIATVRRGTPRRLGDLWAHTLVIPDEKKTEKTSHVPA